MAARNEDLIDTVVFYIGVVLAILGIACAGVAIVKGMILK